MIEPMEIQIPKPDGTEATFTLTKVSATDGREILFKYPVSGLPKIGDYKVNEEIMFKLMSYVYVDLNGKKISLSTKALINNHTGSWETLARLEVAMIEYNCSFFPDGRLSNFLRDIAQKAPQWILKILMGSLASLSAKEKPPSTNSEQSIA